MIHSYASRSKPRSNSGSVFWRKIETSNDLYDMHFFPSGERNITRAFDPMEGHYGIDLVAAPNEVVKAALDGTVIMSTWTLETGM